MSAIQVIGHPEIQEKLRRWVAEDRLPHTLLFHGPPGVGKQTLARWLAQLLLCGSPERPPCGRCAACVKVAHFRHPDFVWLFPTPPRKEFGPQERDQILQARARDPFFLFPFDGPTVIHVEDLRELLTRVHFRPFEGPVLTAIVGDVDRLQGPELVGFLLKTLEEPPPHAYFFLTTSRPAALPATLRSRCTRLAVPPLAPEAMASFFQQAGLQAMASELMRSLSDGAPGRALRLQEEGLESLEGLARDWVGRLLSGPPEADEALTFELAHQWSVEEPSSWEWLWEVTLAILRDLLVSRPSVASQPESWQVTEAIFRLYRLRELRDRRVNPALLVWDLFYQVASASAR